MAKIKIPKSSSCSSVTRPAIHFGMDLETFSQIQFPKEVQIKVQSEIELQSSSSFTEVQPQPRVLCQTNNNNKVRSQNESETQSKNKEVPKTRTESDHLMSEEETQYYLELSEDSYRQEMGLLFPGLAR